MGKVKVLMIDDNISLIKMVKEYFKINDNIEITLEAHNGMEGIELIKSNINDFDIILLDLVMPLKDGIYVLKKLRENNINKKVIVETSYNSPEIIREVSELGATYFILKPYNLEDLEERILTLSNVKQENIINLKVPDLQMLITKLLHNLGVPSHIKGYQYIREGVQLIYENPDITNAITKELYPELARKFGTTASRVERAIRHAIEVSWNRGNWNLMEEIFGCSVDIDKAKPTNSEFIVTIADKLRLETHQKMFI